MGRIVVEARLWNDEDDDEVRAGRIEPLKRKCVVDTGATETVLPEGLVAKLGLKVFSSLTVRYASGKKAQRDLAGALFVEIEGRRTLTRVIVEPGIRSRTPLFLRGELPMGRIVVAARLWNSRQDEAMDAGASAPLVRNCIVDTGATMTVIPQAVVSQLGLRLRGRSG